MTHCSFLSSGLSPDIGRPRRIMIIAGEPSGDLHGAGVVRELKKKAPGAFICGVGGDAMAREGMVLFFHIRSLSVMGVTEVLTRAGTISRVFRGVKQQLMAAPPDLLILIDYPGFNLKMAAVARAAGIPVLYYIAPKVWAWKRSRLEKIKRTVDHVALIFPFEIPLYRRRGIPHTFVGHPLLDLYPSLSQGEKSDENPVYRDLVVGILPGSRNSEIHALLDTLLAAAAMVSRRLSRVTFLVSAAPSVDRGEFDAIAAPWKEKVRFEVVTGSVTRIFSRAHLLIAASGTVSLEAALYRIPTIIVYKVSPITYQLARRLVRVPHVGLANIIAGRCIMPELLQEAASPEKISALVVSLVQGPGLHAMKRHLAMIPVLLGGGGACRRVATLALTLAGKS